MCEGSSPQALLVTPMKVFVIFDTVHFNAVIHGSVEEVLVSLPLKLDLYHQHDQW